MNKRKISAYFPKKELHFAFKRKTSAYSPFARYSIKDKTSYLDGKEVISRGDF
ncbi:hypothetical protein J2Z40_000915 [Cytobacillus eiseniae]|uniref:Uncharacterized protein n=1 Tax=Cytobacillus eiseniae TaxID=762947 RepID=A0ABS4RDA6_9BACI|nr:hypothetical protein [Cytobacillus eiseniae]MBP2240360.1 hypothetical protein [Cytobacillus eiseniae]